MGAPELVVCPKNELPGKLAVGDVNGRPTGLEDEVRDIVGDETLKDGVAGPIESEGDEAAVLASAAGLVKAALLPEVSKFAEDEVLETSPVGGVVLSIGFMVEEAETAVGLIDTCAVDDIKLVESASLVVSGVGVALDEAEVADPPAGTEDDGVCGTLEVVEGRVGELAEGGVVTSGVDAGVDFGVSETKTEVTLVPLPAPTSVTA